MNKKIKFQHFWENRNGIFYEGGKRLNDINSHNYEHKGLVSVLTVCLNSVETIEKCINSIQTQSFKNIEHIIVDGGSTDGTVDILKKYGLYNR